MSLCEDYIIDIDSAYDSCDTWNETFQTTISWFSANLMSPFNMTYKLKILSAYTSIYYALKCLIYGNGDYNLPYRVPYYLRNCVGGDVLNMDAILDAMWASDKTQSFVFINDIDAMRAAIWNMEIYEGSLAEWYRHFMYPK